MRPANIFSYLAITVGTSWASTVGVHSSDHKFCYRDNDDCGPNSDAWDPLCHTGTMQSPIRLPISLSPDGFMSLNIEAYKGNSSRIQNNGHSIQFDFNNEAPSSQILTFPDPLTVKNSDSEIIYRDYKFAAGHFHWGVNDHATGSEHCIGDLCTAMELHLVHYLASYNSMEDALESGDENALAVIGVLINVDEVEYIIGPIPNPPVTSIDPIVGNLELVEFPGNNTSTWTTVNETLDLGKLLDEALTGVYTYKGSLTTPGCNEQVNWYVLKTPAQASHQELEAFRTLVKDEEGETLTENHRPIQATNGRKVLLSRVAAASHSSSLKLNIWIYIFCGLLFGLNRQINLIC